MRPPPLRSTVRSNVHAIRRISVYHIHLRQMLEREVHGPARRPGRRSFPDRTSPHTRGGAMRHVRFLPFALAGLAACSDAITTPDPAGRPADVRAAASAGAALAVSDPQLVAYNEGGLRFGQNLPLADLGGGRVVWQDASSGQAAVLAYDLASGTRTQYATVAGNFAYPVTSGRYTAWSDP